MRKPKELDAHLCVTESIMEAIAEITKILTATRVETLQHTIEDMTVTIPSMVNIPAETNLKALQKTIKNMANKTKVEAVQQTIEHMAATTTDITKILPTTEVKNLRKAMEDTSTSIVTITKIFSELDWDNFEPTDEDVKKAREILSSENIEQTINEGLREKKEGNKLTPAHKTVILDLMLLYHTMIFISDAVTLKIIEERTEKHQ